MPPSPVDDTLRSDPQPVPILAWPAILLGVVCVGVCLYLEADLWITLLTFVGCLVAAVTLTRHYTLDSSRQIVSQADLAFGRWPVARSTFPFERLAGVCTRISRDADSGYQVRVGIRLREGRTLWMKAFPTPDPEASCEAGAYARQISRRTGLPLDGTPG
jgi:hypothetical protein